MRGGFSKAMPYVLISTVMVVAMSLPLFTRIAPFGAGSDLITVIYLFALFRFFSQLRVWIQTAYILKV